jgi:hypothetical protein
MAVDTYALTSVDEVLAYLGEDTQRDGLWVYCSQGDATAATVEVTATTMVLIITGGAAAGTNTLTFADADKNTLAELVIAINALTGWTAGRIYHSSADSTDLVITGALSCLASSNKITLKIQDVYLIERLIDRASSLIERYCNRKFVSRVYTKEVYDGNGHNKLLLEQYPITTLLRLGVGRRNIFSVQNTTATTSAFFGITPTQVVLQSDGGADLTATLSTYASVTLLVAAINGVAGWTCTLMDSDYGVLDPSIVLIPRPRLSCLDPDIAYAEMVDNFESEYRIEEADDETRNIGVIYRTSTFPVGKQNIFVWYTAGYTTIPYALEMACIELVKYKYEMSQRGAGLKSEKMGNVYSYENFSLADLKNGLPLDLIAELDLFRKRDF